MIVRSTLRAGMHAARFAVTMLFALLAGAAVAQSAAPPPPPLPPEGSFGTRPVPPPGVGDPELEPQVTIIRRDTETVEEVRIGGELRFIRVTPRHGRAYYLVPDGNGNQFIRRESLDTTVKVPMWVLFSW
jgi:hypothetical protein